MTRKPGREERPKTAEALIANPTSAAFVVPRAWLIALTLLMIVPWVIAGLVYFRGQERAPVSGDPEGGPPVEGGAGRWGRLTLSPITISPPLEYVGADWGRTAGPDVWYFPGTTPETLEAFLVSSGLSQEDAVRLRAGARQDARSRGLAVAPDPDLVRPLDPAVRSRIYIQLAGSPLNFDQANSFRFFGTSPADWLKGSLISEETRQLVEPLLYRAGDFLHFADYEIVRAHITDPAELQRLAKALLRERTFLVKLSIDEPSEVESLAAYWGIGGRRLDLRPLLESVAGGGQDHSIDIVHLLPSFARDHLYRYPKLTTAAFDKPSLANCLWSSLNFFRPEPDDRFLDVQTALTSLRQDYYLVENGFQLGDILALVDEEGDLFHAAVFLADDLVFTKNGTSPMAPWTIMRVDQVRGYYQAHTPTPRLMYHRRKDL